MAKYDPNKRYTWEPQDKFELDGEQFGRVLNALRAILSSQEAQKILAIEKANDEIEKVMAKAVEDDVAKEIEKQNENS